MRDKLEATRSEIFDVVPFQESRQLGIAEHTENSRLSCAQSPRPTVGVSHRRPIAFAPLGRWDGLDGTGPTGWGWDEGWGRSEV